MLEQDDYFTVTELGLEDLNPYINVNISELTDENGERVPGMVTAVIEVQENLKFHRDLDREKGDPFNQFFTEDGEMTDRVFKVLNNIIFRRYSGEDFEVDGDSADDDYFKFSIALDVPEDTTPEDLGALIWEKTALVQFHNECDPGTFGAEYLFGSLIYTGLRELDA